MTYVTQGGSTGTGQYLDLDSCANTSNNGTCITGDRSISRSFYLDPGYYQVSYYYMAMANFPDVTVPYTYYPQLATFTSWPAYGIDGNATTVRYHPTTIKNLNYLTNVMEVFMSNGQSVSTPINPGSSSVVTTTYNNPDGSTSTTPAYAPDSINTTTYNYSQVNPLLDTVGFNPGNLWLLRTVNVKIQKPGNYWLTFSANNQSAADGYGPGLDDVKVSALGSLYMSTPADQRHADAAGPDSCARHRSPTPIYNNSGAFNGFYIIADPLTPPAADQ